MVTSVAFCTTYTIIFSHGNKLGQQFIQITYLFTSFDSFLCKKKQLEEARERQTPNSGVIEFLLKPTTIFSPQAVRKCLSENILVAFN